MTDSKHPVLHVAANADGAVDLWACNARAMTYATPLFSLEYRAVVCCRDCRHWVKSKRFGVERECACPSGLPYTDGDGDTFCSYGIRKDATENDVNESLVKDQAQPKLATLERVKAIAREWRRNIPGGSDYDSADFMRRICDEIGIE